MKLPWVSRAEYEQQRNWFLRERDDHAEAQKGFCERADAMQARAIRAEELLDAIRAERIAERDAADRRYADLLSRFTALRLQGATEPPAPVAPPAPAERDPAKMAINARFTGPRAVLRGAAMAKLAADRARGVEEVDILRAIEQGETANNGTPA